MKKNILLVILALMNIPLCFGQNNEELSRFIYMLPVMEGMELIGKPENHKVKISDFIEIAIVMKVLNSKEGKDISAEKISKYYYEHFTSLRFNPWQDEAALTGRYQAPRLITKGSAYIWSQGHIRFWIPKEGNAITFCLYQRRDFDVRQSQETIDKISRAFETAAKKLGYEFQMSRNNMGSDWPMYLENECFVDSIVIRVKYKETEGGKVERDDDGYYRFYLSVFPTTQHAEQWRHKTIIEVEKVHRYPNWFEDGLGLSPMVVKNMVIEYKGEVRDQSDPVLRKQLIEELNKIETNKLAAHDGK
ncbi:MAG: hypothetical protein A2Z25_14930 [Planctomycetes bacterium RBG_16_55_9]|nr:MAG: hypothetical protein A2Z25_14930 [Planctomycetes bacterium RBG_16_55_9]